MAPHEQLSCATAAHGSSCVPVLQTETLAALQFKSVMAAPSAASDMHLVGLCSCTHVYRSHLDVLHDADKGVEAVQIALGQRVQVPCRQRLGAHPRQPAPQQRRLLDPQLRGSSSSIQQLARQSCPWQHRVYDRALESLKMSATVSMRCSEVNHDKHSAPQPLGCPSATLPRALRQRWPEGRPATQAADRPPHQPAA